MSVERARHVPIRTALSGPAAGAVGAIHMARLSGLPDVISLDMGGTSADVALIRDYTAGTTFNKWIEGYPARLASLDINAVGAGGGSIAWFDRDGLMKVGPQSAGAQPGPACYGRGGTEATVTDANLVLGRLSPRGLLGGGMALDESLARKAIAPLASGWAFPSSAPRMACSASSWPTWCARSARCRSSVGTIRAPSRCCRSAARARCMRPMWRRASASAAASCRSHRASSARRG
jgi:N-methylhydantoinase A/oxoprolinase/acetone carboxylase beta subunit